MNRMQAVAEWRKAARYVVSDPDSPASLRALAWRFLKQWGAR